MAFPWTPSDLKAALAPPTGKVCSKLVSTLLEIPALLLQAVTWAVDDAGNPTPAFLAWIGQATTGGIQAPTNLRAVGSVSDITLTWDTVAAATSYDVYRSSAPMPPTVGSTIPLVSGLATNTFTDSASVGSDPPFQTGVTWYYWVVAKNSSATSVVSNVTASIAGAGNVTQNFDPGITTQDVAVPVGYTQAAVTLYGGGGGGGGSFVQPPFGSLAPPQNGGGGGSGEKRVITLTGLIAGTDILNLWVASGGLGGARGVQGSSPAFPGHNGDDSWLDKNSSGTHLATAKGGIGGGAANPASSGLGSAGGSDGSGGVGTDGNAGSNGTPTVSGSGGAGGTALAPDNKGAGGTGGTSSDGVAGGGGYVTITFSP